ncbi:MAG: zf-HC2 domain-containing protein [Candidatus Eremiobacteraeota bacterium]|nr:zf-HC2 domain-containing protein [Candidatus Eremiobacteraeota bacterium]
MNCDEFQNRISFFIDKEISPDEEREFRQHLNNCGKCKRALDEYHSINRLVESIPAFTPPEMKASDFIKTPKKWDKGKEFVLLPALRFSLVSALIIVIIVAGIFLYINRSAKIGISIVTPVESPVKPYTDIAFEPGYNKIHYDMVLDETTYDITVEGEGVKLVSFEISENDNKGVKMNFQ